MLTAVFMVAAFGVLPPGNVQFALIVAGGLMMAASVGPICAVVIDVVHPAVRATAASVLSLMQNLFGLAADRCSPASCPTRYGLPFALAVVPVFCLLAAALLRARRPDVRRPTFERADGDERPARQRTRAPTRLMMTMNDEENDVRRAPRAAIRRRRARASRASGNWNPDWEPFAKLDPAWTEKVIAMAIAPAVSGALDAKTIELIGIALDASCTHMYAPGVRRHIQRALKAGATREGNHGGAAACEHAGASQHVPRRADPARGARCPRQARRLTNRINQRKRHELPRRIALP